MLVLRLFLAAWWLLFEASGGIYGFTDIAAKICKGEKRTLLAGWLLGIVTFVDDWLSILSVGTAMRRATDRFHIPREMLAFLSNATASSICVIVPTSTWGVFMISQLVATGVCPSEAGMATFVATLPFLFYPFAALLCGLLYGWGFCPNLAPCETHTRWRNRGKSRWSRQRRAAERNPRHGTFCFR